MALIMKYIDSMHHYMDKYGGKYRENFISSSSKKTAKGIYHSANCYSHNNPVVTFTHR